MYGLAKGGQTDSQVGSQVAKSHKFHAYQLLVNAFYNKLLAINLCRLVLGGQMVKNLCLLACKFELDQSQRKSTQVVASGWPNKTQVERKSKTCIDLRVCLARALEFKIIWLNELYPKQQPFEFYINTNNLYFRKILLKIPSSV